MENRYQHHRPKHTKGKCRGSSRRKLSWNKNFKVGITVISGNIKADTRGRGRRERESYNTQRKCEGNVVNVKAKLQL